MVIQVPVVITCHPFLKSVGIVLYKNLYLLNMDKWVKKVFTVTYTVSFKSAWTLRISLVRAKFYPLERTVRPFKCSKHRCINVIELDKITSTATKKALKPIINLNVMTNT